MDISPLLDPISSDSPAGVDLRQIAGDLTFERLRDLRTELSPEEDLASGQGKDPDWRAIVECCHQALAERTKDLEIANHLTEAWTQTLGYTGLAAGLGLVRQLIEQFWDQLHPGREANEIVEPMRARHLGWLGGADRFLRSVRESALIRLPDGASLSWAQREEARRLEELRMRSPEAWREAQRAGALLLEDFEARLRTATPEGLRDALAALQRCSEELASLFDLCHKHFHEENEPSLIGLRDLLDEQIEFVKRLLPPEPEAQAEDTEGDAESAAPGPAQSRRTPAGPIHSRADALRLLAEIAAFLRETEPHSPVSYLIQRAVRWGEMPLAQVLQEVVKDPAVLSHIWDTLGIAPPEE